MNTTTAAPASTLIPFLNLTFAEASARIDAILAESETAGWDDQLRLAHERQDILVTMLSAEPRTVADGAAIMARLRCPITGIPVSENDLHQLAVEAVHRLLVKLAG